MDACMGLPRKFMGIVISALWAPTLLFPSSRDSFDIKRHMSDHPPAPDFSSTIADAQKGKRESGPLAFMRNRIILKCFNLVT